jgi:type II secretory pathway pseudopilin PulG
MVGCLEAAWSSRRGQVNCASLLPQITRTERLGGKTLQELYGAISLVGWSRSEQRVRAWAASQATGAAQARQQLKKERRRQPLPSRLLDTWAIGPLKTNPSGGERKLPNPDKNGEAGCQICGGCQDGAPGRKGLGSAGRGLLKKSDADASPSPRGTPTRKREVAGTLQQCGGDRACERYQPR